MSEYTENENVMDEAPEAAEETVEETEEIVEAEETADEETEQADDSVLVRVRKQYNDKADVSEYFN